MDTNINTVPELNSKPLAVKLISLALLAYSIVFFISSTVTLYIDGQIRFNPTLGSFFAVAIMLLSFLLSSMRITGAVLYVVILPAMHYYLLAVMIGGSWGGPGVTNAEIINGIPMYPLLVLVSSINPIFLLINICIVVSIFYVLFLIKKGKFR